MAKFVAVLQDKNEGDFPPGLLEDHIEHLRGLHYKGALFLCGPLKNAGRALQILEADSYSEAEGYVLKDPFIAHKYYAGYTLYELIEANEDNNYLM